jgi:transposase
MTVRKKCPDGVPERSVRLVRESGRSIAHVAEDLGIHREALRLWVRQDDADRGERGDLRAAGIRRSRSC